MYCSVQQKSVKGFQTLLVGRRVMIDDHRMLLLSDRTQYQNRNPERQLAHVYASTIDNRPLLLINLVNLNSFFVSIYFKLCMVYSHTIQSKFLEKANLNSDIAYLGNRVFESALEKEKNVHYFQVWE